MKLTDIWKIEEQIKEKEIELDKDQRTGELLNSRTGITIIIEVRMVVITGDGLLIGKGHVRTFQGARDILYFSLGGGYMRKYIYKNSLCEFID